MKELEMFTVERLENILKSIRDLGIGGASKEEIISLAKFALAEKKGRWIKFSERIPEEGELIIFSIKDYGVTTGHYEESPSLFIDEDLDIYPPHIVTHWQQMPEAPKEIE